MFELPSRSMRQLIGGEIILRSNRCGGLLHASFTRPSKSESLSVDYETLQVVSIERHATFLATSIYSQGDRLALLSDIALGFRRFPMSRWAFTEIGEMITATYHRLVMGWYLWEQCRS